MIKHIWTTRQRLILVTLFLFWVGSSFAFWHWWFNPQHFTFLFGFLLNTFVVAWTYVLPLYCWYFIFRMVEHPNSKTPLPSDWRVAMIVTKVPSEPLSMLKKTIKAMLAQSYPHDTWVADEDPTSEALDWYSKNNVKVSCRRDNSDYHNDSWPRRRRIKEGNLAYFYDHYGYENYDIVVQLDADHVPSPQYLEEMLKPFVDPEVSYVAAPSMTDSNHEKWSARARSSADALFQGPLQAGYNRTGKPLCIGSHYALRTSSLKDIGGIGPELAEDHSTTFLLQASGYKGAFAHQAEAHGVGPNTFYDLIVQDYQWSRSLLLIFLGLTATKMRALTFHQRIHFSFAQLWYPLTSLAWFCSILIPVTALLYGHEPISVSFAEFLRFSALPFIIITITLVYVRRAGHLRPKTANFLSWENALFELGRWPWIFISLIDALWITLSRKVVTIKVTPKKARKNLPHGPLPSKVFLPYLVVVVLDLLAILLRRDGGFFAVYFGFALVTAWLYLSLVVTVLYLHWLENRAGAKHGVSFGLGKSLLALVWSLLVGALLLTTVRTVTFPLNASVPEMTKQEITPAIPPHTYQVKYGDTLWGISKTYYGDGSVWHKITPSDKSGLIRPGEILTLP